MSGELTFPELFRRILIPRVWPWITLIIAAVMAYALYAGLHALPLALRGVTTEARQTNLQAIAHICHADRCGPVTKGQRYWRVTRSYAFTTQTGREVQARITERLAFEPVQHAGITRAVIYMPRNPSQYIIGGMREVMAQLVISGGLAAAVLLFLGYEVVTSYRRAQQGIHVMQAGARRKARVTVVPTGAKGDAARAIYWALPGGRIGKSLPLPKEAERPAYGSEIEVYDDGQVSWWVEDLRPL